MMMRSFADMLVPNDRTEMGRVGRIDPAVLGKAFRGGLWRRIRRMSRRVCCWRGYGRKERPSRRVPRESVLGLPPGVGGLR